MKRLFCALLVFVAVLGLAGCNANAQTTSIEETIDEDDQSMKLVINGMTFEIVLENNATTKALVKLLPMNILMNELNGNEKYCYLDTNLPTNIQKINHINTGDIMLFGNNCLVVFYQSFSTNYSYTKIGKITDAVNLPNVIGSGDVKVEWKQ